MQRIHTSYIIPHHECKMLNAAMQQRTVLQMNKRMMQGKVNLQSWVAADTFATVTDWLVRARGAEPTSVSNVVELVFEELAMVALDNGGAAIIDAEEIDRVMQAIALNRYRGRSLARLSAKREFQSEQWRDASADAAVRPHVLGPEQRSAEAARQRIAQGATPEEVRDIGRSVRKMRPEDVDPKLRAQIERAAQQIIPQLRAMKEHDVQEELMHNELSIPPGQETISEPDEGEFSVETARAQREQLTHDVRED